MTRQKQIINIKDELNDIRFSSAEHRAEQLIIEAMGLLKMAAAELDRVETLEFERWNGVR